MKHVLGLLIHHVMYKCNVMYLYMPQPQDLRLHGIVESLSVFEDIFNICPIGQRRKYLQGFVTKTWYTVIIIINTTNTQYLIVELPF